VIGALPDDGLTLREATLLEQAGDLLGLPPVHVGEKLDALQGGHGVARSGAGRRSLAACLPGGDGAALEQVERPVLERPLGVAPRPVDLLAQEGQLAQGRENTATKCPAVADARLVAYFLIVRCRKPAARSAVFVVANLMRARRRAARRFRGRRKNVLTVYALRR